MTERQVSSDHDDEPMAIYEIRLQGAAPAPLRRQFPSATVFTRRTETVLFHRVDEPAQLDELIEQLLSMGLVLTEVHELPLPGPSAVEPRAQAREEEQLDADL